MCCGIQRVLNRIILYIQNMISFLHETVPACTSELLIWFYCLHSTFVLFIIRGASYLSNYSLDCIKAGLTAPQWDLQERGSPEPVSVKERTCSTFETKRDITGVSASPFDDRHQP